VSLGLIWAEARDRVIGRGGGLPWHIPEDSAHFRQITFGATVVMGSRTWDSLPERFRPLTGRRNIVVSRRDGLEVPGAELFDSVEGALAAARADDATWVIGGGQLYAATIGLADRLEITEIDLDATGDTRAPEVGPEWTSTDGDPVTGWHTSRIGVRYRFRSYLR
jgi:dihydrofolate reductase